MKYLRRCLLILAGILSVSAHAQFSSSAALLQQFAAPPDDSRPMMRWWWFGPAVVDSELARELHAMQAAGFGGVEIQPVYPLALDDPAHGIRNLPYLSPEFLAAVHFSDVTARGLGLRVDITLGSGWPYGGPGATLELSAGRLKLAAFAASSTSLSLPPAAKGDTLIAAFTAPGTPESWSAAGAKQIPLAPGAAALAFDTSATHPTVLLLFYSSHTLQQVKRPSAGAEGLVIDHFSRASIEEHLEDVADKLAGAFGSQPPYSVFSDSLEVYGSDWTLNLPAEFQRRRGYDILPLLPELYAGGTEAAAAIRNDWGRTLSDLIRENYLQPLDQWAKAHHTLFRSQTYGEPAVTLADEAVPSLPEGEGPQWRQFSFTRWATSASHLYHRPVTSAETFTWLHSPVFRATPLDMKLEADRMFLSGVNQIIGHGWPYTPQGIPEPGWNLYAAAVFNDHNPWFPVMPDVVQYMHRASWILRQGEPATDVAILLPEDDAQAAFTPGHVSVTDEMKKRITPELMRTVLDAGYNLDYMDAATIDHTGMIPYPILILPPTQRIPLSTARILRQYAAHGGHLIATGTIPVLAPGLEHQADSHQVAGLLQEAFAEEASQKVSELSALPSALHQALAPDFASTRLPDPSLSGNDPNAGLGFIHRTLSGTDIYFVVNSATVELSTALTFRARRRSMTELSLDAGAPGSHHPGDQPVSVTLAPYESRVFVLSDEEPSPAMVASQSKPTLSLPSLNSGWTITFPNSAPQALPAFVSWDSLPDRKFFSGEAIYSNTFELASAPRETDDIVLDFGAPTPTIDTRPPGSAGIHALLDPPVRDAAVVFVNGQRAGPVWHPPYRVEVTPLLRPGRNKIEVDVYNTAVNQLAGQPPRDYSALSAKYGKRFDPQDMDQIHPLPSGLIFAPVLRRQ